MASLLRVMLALMASMMVSHTSAQHQEEPTFCYHIPKQSCSSPFIKRQCPILCGPVQNCSCDNWDYRGYCGEDVWDDFCPNQCNSKNPKYMGQSPINIVNPEFVPFKDFDFVNHNITPATITIKNNGLFAVCTWAFPSQEVPTVSGGNLTGNYIFEKMEFHIGCEDGVGSEHLTDGRSQSGELQLYYYSDIYGDYNTALSSNNPNAIAAFGIFLKIQGLSLYGDLYGDMVNNLPDRIGQTTTLFNFTHTLEEFYPRSRLFYRYSGSLTSPSCNNRLVWTVFDEPAHISQDHIDAFRQMQGISSSFEKLCNNHRLTQPLNRRKVSLFTYVEE